MGDGFDHKKGVATPGPILIMRRAEAVLEHIANGSAAGARECARLSSRAEISSSTDRVIAGTVDDLKLRSVQTLFDGSENPDFDTFTPRFIAGHFKSEQRRTGGDDPRDWRTPKGYQAQHPNGRPYKRYGEPPGTTLTWGTTHDNRDLQKPREFGQTPHAKPNPIPGN